MSEYKIQYGVYEGSLIDKVVDLFTYTFYWTKKFSREYLEWQYLQNPNGNVVSFNAFAEDDTLAAHYAAIPVQMILDGKITKGLLSLNTATHPNHQGKRLFTILADKTYSYAKDNGYEFVIGVANANSTHGFLKNLGFYLVAPLDFKIGIGDIFKSEIPQNMNRLFYSQEVLEWRLRCPEYKYSMLHNTIHSSRKEPLFHTSVAKIPDGIDVNALDLKRTFDVFNIYIGLGANTKNGLYVGLPKFIKRSPFNLIFKDLTGGELPMITKDNIFFQLLDYDVA